MRRTLRFLLPVAALAAALTLPAPGLAAAPAGGLLPSADVTATIGSCALFGYTRPNTTFRLAHKAPSGSNKATTVITSDDIGFWQRLCPGPTVAIGDRLEFRLVGDPTVFTALTIPALTLTTDRVADRIRGTAKGVAQVGLNVQPCDPLRTACNSGPSTDAPVDAVTRAFSWTVPADVNGLSRVRLTWKKNGHTVFLLRDAARLEVRIGSATVTGVGPRARATATVSLRRDGSTTTASRKTAKDASFSVTLKRAGAPLKVRTGDRISSSIAGNASMTVPAVPITVTPGGATGTCFKQQQYNVILRAADGSYMAGASGTTGTNGTWDLGTAIQAGWTVHVWCANGKGDVVRRSVVVN